MLQPRLRAAGPSSSFLSALSRLTVSPPRTQTRAASHASQGRANKAAPGPGKRLGAKKSDSEPVVPGNIIFRQRGTHWFPGENCTMGRDHTISAIAKGFVRYYKDPDRHPERKYIGVVFEQHENLPRPRNASRRRRLGMEAVVIEHRPINEEAQLGDDVRTSDILGASLEGRTPIPIVLRPLAPRHGYQYRESNWSIGRTAERRGVKVTKFNPRDRFAAWRRTTERKKISAEMRSLRKSVKNSKNKNKNKKKK